MNKLIIACVGFLIFSGCSSKVFTQIHSNEVCHIAADNKCSSNKHYFIFCYPITNESKDILKSKVFVEFGNLINKKLDKFFNLLKKKYNYIVSDAKKAQIKSKINSFILSQSEVKESCDINKRKYFVILLDKESFKNELKSFLYLPNKQFEEAFNAVFG